MRGFRRAIRFFFSTSRPLPQGPPRRLVAHTFTPFTASRRLLTTSSTPPVAGPLVVSLSGGIESTVLVHYATNISGAGRPVHALFFDYAQKNVEAEWASTKAICQHYRVPNLQRVDLSGVGQQFRRLQGAQQLHVPIPHRNLPVLALSLSYAAQVRASELQIGVIKDDHAYLSSGQPFFEAFTTICSTLEPTLKVSAPLLSYSKADVINMGARQQVPLHLTYSCIVGPRAPRKDHTTGLHISDPPATPDEVRAAAAALAGTATTTTPHLQPPPSQHAQGPASPSPPSSPFSHPVASSAAATAATVSVPSEELLIGIGVAGFVHCGNCMQCRKRKEAFLGAGVHDPTVYL